MAIWTELYSFTSIITMTVLQENRNVISGLENASLIYGLSGTAIAGHGLALVSTFMAVRYGWKVNFHFTRQEKLVYAERLRQRKRGKGGVFGVAELDDEHEFNIGGMEKGLRKMYEDKEWHKKQERKRIELERIEEEEDQRVIAEQKGNLF